MTSRVRRLAGGRNSSMRRENPPNENIRSMYDCVIMHDGEGLRKPMARSGHRIVADETNLYCFGGYNPQLNNLQNETFGLFPELWKFNFCTRKWTEIKSDNACPAETASHSMVLLGSTILVFGGTGFPFGERCSNAVHAFDLSTNKWREISCGGELPTPRYGQSLTFKDGNIYVMGGTSGHEYNMSVYRLNLETVQWSHLAQYDQANPMDILNQAGYIPEPRYRHECVTFSKYIYVLGGGTVQEVFDFVKVPAFNTETNEWSELESKGTTEGNRYPHSRKFHAAVQFMNYAYLCGGFDGTETMYNDIWRLDLTTLQWEELKDRLPMPIYFHSATVTPAGCMYIFGGVVNTSGNQRSDFVFKKWLTVPSLQELVWDRINLKHHKVLAAADTKNPRQLRSVGFHLPPKFFKRLE
ncbi:hypothetical protein RvY_01175 [Ramazzottius varieornatus]|uniref:Kelch domain-containing protein 10 n=1 Tax=Ramazzottius varieornatus TaxID=947166 RepID=A0A1D1UQ45_RAMVA|nr:hypothetical protein RvY_01175 [Ramazzottius varieornatus]